MRVVPDSKNQSDVTEGRTGERASGEHPATDASALLRDGARALAPLAGDDTVYALLASARHELRSPLQSIQGFAELLASKSYGELSDDQHMFVQHILQGSEELGSVVEACLELAEVELLGRALEPTRTDLRSALSDALAAEHNTTGTVVESDFAPATQTVRVRFDRALLRRGLHALLTAMSSGPNKTIQARVELFQEHAHLLLTRRGLPEGQQLATTARSRAEEPRPTSLDAKASEGPEALLTVSELARRRRATRSLIWLRLANAVLALLDSELRVSERLDRAEVRFRLSSTH